MPFRAKLTALRTRPYRPDELAQMAEEERERYRSGYYENILGEDVIQELTADSPEELGKRVSEIAEERKPRPIILTTPQADELPLKHMFLTRRAYVRDDEQRMFEIIVFGPKDPAVWKEKMSKAYQKPEPKPLSLEEKEKFNQRAVSSMVEKTMDMMPSMMETFAKQMGFASYEEFSSLMAKKKEGMTNEQFSEFFRCEMSGRQVGARSRRRQELANKPPYDARHLPAMLNDEMIVICRIFGKDQEDVYKHLEYYKSFHRMSEPVFVVDNGADDGMHVSFIYGKEAGDQDGEQTK